MLRLNNRLKRSFFLATQQYISTNTRRSLNTKARLQLTPGRDDLTSIDEFTKLHLQDPTKERKYHFTTDSQTIELANSIIDSSRNPQYFKELLLTKRSNQTNQKGSKKVLISDIRDFDEYYEIYQKNRQENKSALLNVGGPAAEHQTLISSMVDSIRQKLYHRIFLTASYGDSNAWHSAKQSHARHANALNADKSLTGHKLLKIIFLRKLFGEDIAQILEPDYVKIDVDFTLDFKKLQIYFGNEINWLKQRYLEAKGQLTEHDINRIEAKISQDIKDIIKEVTGLDIAGRTGNPQETSAIHIALTENEAKNLKHENTQFEKVGIKSEALTNEEIKSLFGDKKIIKAYKYFYDTYMKFDDHAEIAKYAQDQGAKWIEGEEITRIFLIPNEKSNAQMAGVLTKNGQFIYADKLHFTGGYMVDYEFDTQNSPSRFNSDSILRNIFNKIYDLSSMSKPLNNEITTATGVSITAIFKKSDEMKTRLEKFGSTGEIAVTNSHWTMIIENEDYVVMRMTGGGNTGSESYKSSYFLNIMSNTREIFGDDLIGIVSTYGCPRAVNAKNSTEFAKIAEGFIISYGKGGTGYTKKESESALGLMMLGFDEEVVEYFNQFNNRDNKPVGDELLQILQHMQQTKIYHDNIDKTNKRMGYDSTMTFPEILTITMLTIALSYCLIQQSSKDHVDSSTSIRSPRAVQIINSQERTKG